LMGNGTDEDYITWQANPGVFYHLYLTTDSIVRFATRRTAVDSFAAYQEVEIGDTMEAVFYSDSLIRPVLNVWAHVFSTGEDTVDYRVWLVADSVGQDTTETNCTTSFAKLFAVPASLGAILGDTTDRDCFLFPLQKDSTYVFRLDTASKYHGDIAGSLYSMSLNTSLNRGDSVVYTAEKDDTVKVTVTHGSSGEVSYGKYVLQVSKGKTPGIYFADAYEPNSFNAPTVAVADDRAYHFTQVYGRKDEDAFVFPRADSIDYLVYVTDPAGAYAAHNVSFQVLLPGADTLNKFSDSTILVTPFDGTSSELIVQLSPYNHFEGDLHVKAIRWDEYEGMDSPEATHVQVPTSGNPLERTLHNYDSDDETLSLQDGVAYTLEIQGDVELEVDYSCPIGNIGGQETVSAGVLFKVSIPAGAAQNCWVGIYAFQTHIPMLSLGHYTAFLRPQ